MAKVLTQCLSAMAQTLGAFSEQPLIRACVLNGLLRNPVLTAKQARFVQQARALQQFKNF